MAHTNTLLRCVCVCTTDLIFTSVFQHVQASQDLQEVKIRDFLQFLNCTLSTTALYNFSLELCVLKFQPPVLF